MSISPLLFPSGSRDPPDIHGNAKISITSWTLGTSLSCLVVSWPSILATFEIIHGFVYPLIDLFPVVSIVFIDGFIKPHTPGSLREPAVTYLFPANWLTLPLSFGLLMSPWGGHSVFPNIYRDMRHPYKFKRAVKVTFTFTVSLLPHFCLNVYLMTIYSTCSTALQP